MRKFFATSLCVLFCLTCVASAQNEEAKLIEPKRSSFNVQAPAELEVRKTLTGHLLVKSKVNGKDAGWFILDTGAGMSCIDKAVADEMKLPEGGGITARGIGGDKETKLRTFDSLSLGGITLEEGKLLELNLKPYGLLMGAGVPIAGIIGHDCFMAGVFDIDLANATVAVHDPKTFKLADSQGVWTAVKLVGRRPAVEGRIEGSEPGMLLLDTGSNDGLLVHSPTVKKLNLLDGRQTRQGKVGGEGGGMKSVRTGKLKSVTVGGCEIADVPASFAETTDGLTASDEVLATTGLKFLRNFRMIVNQSMNSIAFSRTKSPATRPSASAER